MRKRVLPFCRIQKRGEDPPIGFGQLKPPFKTITTFIGIPQIVDWENFLRRNYGPGEYLIVVFGYGFKGVWKIFHGKV